MSGGFFPVPGTAVPWARAGAVGKRRFTPAKQTNFMGVLQVHAREAMAGRAPIEGPVELQVMAAYAWPSSWSKKRRADPLEAWKVSRPDADNLSKLVADALNGLAFVDDAQVVSLHVWKRYETIPLLAVRVTSLGETLRGSL